MFSFFGNEKDSLLWDFDSIDNNQTADDYTDTGSSLDSYSRYSRDDDESTLGSHRRAEVDAEINFETQDSAPVVETSLSNSEVAGDEDNSESNSIDLSMKNLRRLVGITSEEERCELIKSEMPSYMIRRKIATKVMAKKVSKGHVILEEMCKLCDMPMMEGRGRKECRICPAIQKWKRKHDSKIDEDDQKNNNSEAEDEKYSMLDTEQFITTEIRKSILALNPVPEKLDVSDIDVAKYSEKTSMNAPNNLLQNTPKNSEMTQIDEVGNEMSMTTIDHEDRANQNIKEVKCEGENSRLINEDDEATYYQGVAEARAELIIKRARASLHKDVDEGSEVESEIVTADIILMKAKESLQMDVVRPLVSLPSLTSMSRITRNNGADYTGSGSISHDAAKTIQAFIRMVLTRKAFLDYMRENGRPNNHHELLTSSWKVDKADVIFETRSRDHVIYKDDPDGVVYQKSSTVLEDKHYVHGSSKYNRKSKGLRISIDPEECEEEVNIRHLSVTPKKSIHKIVSGVRRLDLSPNVKPSDVQPLLGAGSKNKHIRNDLVPSLIESKSRRSFAQARNITKPDPEPASVIQLPCNHKSSSSHSSKTSSTVLAPPSYMNASSFQGNSNPYRWRMSEINTYFLQRPFGSQSCARQWVMRNQYSPSYNMSTQNNIHDSNHQCGSYTTAQADSIIRSSALQGHNSRPITHFLDDDGGEKNSFSIAHQRMISNSSNAIDMPPREVQIIPNRQMIREDSFAQNQLVNGTLQQEDQHQKLGIPPRHFYNDICIKENSYESANMKHEHKELSSIDEAKMRMENAQNAMRREMLYHSQT